MECYQHRGDNAYRGDNERRTQNGHCVFFQVKQYWRVDAKKQCMCSLRPGQMRYSSVLARDLFKIWQIPVIMTISRARGSSLRYNRGKEHIWPKVTKGGALTA